MSLPSKHTTSRWMVFAALALAALLGIALPGCSTDPGRSVSSTALFTAPESATGDVVSIGKHRVLGERLLELPGVVGVGTGLGSNRRPVVLVLLERGGVQGIPDHVEGVPVVVEVVGRIVPFALTDRVRPVPIGVSAGNANECLPGTIGCVLERDGAHYLLSANHVFARQNQASIGERIIQPSLPDADPACGPAPPPTMVARLSDFEPVVYDARTENLMDAAIAELTTDDFTCATLPQFYGSPSTEVSPPAVGAAVLKVGRTTELTRGFIKAIGVKVKIAFPAGTALFVDQVMTSKGFGAFGDSGSLMVTDDGQYRPVGIVIGGSSNGVAIVSPIGPILQRFGAQICGD